VNLSPVLALGAVALVILVLAAIPYLLAVVRVARRRAADRSSPPRQAEAKVLDKRTHVTGGGNSPVEQEYFVSFQLATGERLELRVPGSVSGVLMPGDEGALEWKGSRYLGFAREILR
jgi:hypothetical protein